LNPGSTLRDLSGDAFVGKTLGDVLKHSVSYQGKVYAAVLDAPSTYGVIYNKQVFARLGVSVPTSLSQLESVCQTMHSKDASVAPIYVGGGDTWPGQLVPISFFSTGLKADPNVIAGINNNTDSFKNKAFVDGFTATTALKSAGCYNSDLLSGTYNKSVDAVMKGTAAMTFQPSGAIPASFVAQYGLPAVNQKLGFFPISIDSNVAAWGTAGYGVFLPKTSSSDKQREGDAFIDFATGPYYQTYLNNAGEEPALSGFTAPAGIPDAVVTAYQAFQADSVPEFQQDLLANYSGEFPNWVMSLLAGKDSASSVAGQLQTSFATNAKQVGLSGY
jgi:raffinose/stachyose/melibiose transport system substrate-binding protein